MRNGDFDDQVVAIPASALPTSGGSGGGGSGIEQALHQMIEQMRGGRGAGVNGGIGTKVPTASMKVGAWGMG